jgi:hypothetical protein
MNHVRHCARILRGHTKTDGLHTDPGVRHHFGITMAYNRECPRVNVPICDVVGEVMGRAIIEDLEVSRRRRPRWLFVPTDTTHPGLQHVDAGAIVYHAHRIQVAPSSLIVVPDFVTVWALFLAGCRNVVAFPSEVCTELQATLLAGLIPDDCRVSVVLPMWLGDLEAWTDSALRHLARLSFCRCIEIDGCQRELHRLSLSTL